MADRPPPPPPPPPPPSSPDQGDKSRAEQPWSKWLVWAFAFAVLSAFVLPGIFGSGGGEEITYGDFLGRVERGLVKEVEFDNHTGGMDAVLRDGTKVQTTGPLDLSDADETFLRANTDFKYNTPGTNILTGFILPIFAPIAIIVLILLWFQRRAQGQMGSIMSIGRSKAKTYSTERPGTTFDDVAGYEGVKQEIKEVVDFLKDAEKFAAIGARIPKGVLLVGPPGTGKTLIARAVAGEAGVPFLSVTGSDFMEMFVGVGASRVRDLFQSARKMGRAIIFIDEIDSIGRKRGAGLGGGHDEREQTLNQMLSEMDGFEATEGVVIMAATNRPDILDSALLRPGRFDRQVIVSLPELSDRRAILDVHVKSKRMDPDVDLNVVARGTPGMSGADLANLINEAALIAVRDGDKTIAAAHLEQARDRVLMGQKRESTVLSAEEKERVAYHESGHALAAAVLPDADPLHKVTIIPRGMALGVTMTLPEEERYLLRESYITAELIKMMGGRMAEELVFGEVSSGAADDLARATDLAGKMVREWGMSERIGPMAWRGGSGQVFLGEDMGRVREYSDDLAAVIDEEIERILRSAETRCRDLLTEHRNGLDLVARNLLEHETIDGEEVNRLIELGKAPSDSTQPSSNGDSGSEAENPPDPAADPPVVETYTSPSTSTD